MDWIERVGIVAGALVSVIALLVLATKILDRVNQILDTREDATAALNVARAVERKVDELHTEVLSLARATTDTFRQRTEDFTRIAAEAASRLHTLEGDVNALKVRLAREEGRHDAHAIEDDRRFERIETALSAIRVQLTTITSAQAAAGGSMTGSGPV